MITASSCIVTYIPILLRWRGPINVWYTLYISPPSFGIGLLTLLQFVRWAAAVERP